MDFLKLPQWNSPSKDVNTSKTVSVSCISFTIKTAQEAHEIVLIALSNGNDKIIVLIIYLCIHHLTTQNSFQHENFMFFWHTETFAFSISFSRQFFFFFFDFGNILLLYIIFHFFLFFRCISKRQIKTANRRGFSNRYICYILMCLYLLFKMGFELFPTHSWLQITQIHEKKKTVTGDDDDVKIKVM